MKGPSRTSWAACSIRGRPLTYVAVEHRPATLADIIGAGIVEVADDNAQARSWTWTTPLSVG